MSALPEPVVLAEILEALQLDVADSCQVAKALLELVVGLEGEVPSALGSPSALRLTHAVAALIHADKCLQDVIVGGRAAPAAQPMSIVRQ